MYKDILSKEQYDILPLISKFSKDFYLVGGTAIALQLGHRHSIDFDLFTGKELKRKQIKNIIQKNGFIPDKIIYEAYDQMHLVIEGVKVTFFQYEHEIKANLNFESIINIPSLQDLAAMKAYAPQLSYYDDIDYSEEVVYLPGQDVSEEEIKRFLIDVATEEF